VRPPEDDGVGFKLRKDVLDGIAERRIGHQQHPVRCPGHAEWWMAWRLRFVGHASHAGPRMSFRMLLQIDSFS